MQSRAGHLVPSDLFHSSEFKGISGKIIFYLVVACRILVPRAGIEPMPPCIGSLESFFFNVDFVT